MKKIILTISIILVLNYATLLAFAANSTTDQTEVLNLVNKELSNFRTSPANPYLELTDKHMQTFVGKPNNVSGNVFTAETSGIFGVSTAFKTNQDSFNLLYGKDGQNIFAANFATSLRTAGNIDLSALYFKTKSSFVGFKVSSQLAPKLIVSAETSENLTDLTKGYLFTTKYQDIQQDNFDISISYRDVQSTAISDYSANTAFADSKGFRLETNYKLAPQLTLTASQDLAEAQDKSNKNTSRIIFTWKF
ncbi:MAG: hypothetical protein LLG02_17325 [Pelosinus sp.]|nr:hypothetical protein [Pelosinus sp.]